MVKSLTFFIESKLLLAFAAVALCAETQILLVGKIDAHHSWWVVFWGTLMAYRLHGNWQGPKTFLYLTTPPVVVGVLYQWRNNGLALLVLGLLAVMTFMYSYPFSHPRLKWMQLRNIPYGKIFLIAGVWAAATVLLPAFFLHQNYDQAAVGLVLAERFLFVVAITLPFDIRDMAADQRDGLVTIPLKIGEKKALVLAKGLVILFMAMAVLHSSLAHQWFIGLALLLSGSTTLVVLHKKQMQSNKLYYQGTLDGMLLVQAVLVWVTCFLTKL